jgi:hypothetical protein
MADKPKQSATTARDEYEKRKAEVAANLKKQQDARAKEIAGMTPEEQKKALAADKAATAEKKAKVDALIGKK